MPALVNSSVESFGISDDEGETTWPRSSKKRRKRRRIWSTCMVGLVYRRMGSRQVGVDVGGTFTDVVGFDPASGALDVAKVPSTPADQADAVVAGLASMGL